MTNASSTDTVAAAGNERDSNSVVKPAAALMTGVVLLVVAFANLSRVPGWADEHGAIWVYLVFFLYMSIAGRLFWIGADDLAKQLRR
ncbi:hypothetical protein JK358_38535 [Nocardia sp. 2]|uniref:Uncharacterized protein n=1 Tax=Nocardia acididurans TaxID=2802282 RepID=A0ABS1MJU1_9NOCA|nr:hypothetical protein [Nocardia acididurans]MBL1080310.1 hypothetical protein [Nocardia acididurans]